MAKYINQQNNSILTTNVDNFESSGSLGPSNTVKNLTDEHKKGLRFLIDEKRNMSQRASQYKDDIKAFAEKLGTKPGNINRLISLAIQEEEKGGVIFEQSSVLEWVEQLLNSNQNCSNTSKT